MGALVSMDLFGKSKVAENSLIHGPGDGGSLRIWYSQDVGPPSEVVCEYPYPSIPSGG